MRACSIVAAVRRKADRIYMLKFRREACSELLSGNVDRPRVMQTR